MNINELKKGDKVWVRGFIDCDGDLMLGNDLTYIKSSLIYTIDDEDIKPDGYAEQSPKHLKNIIAKLRELPEYDKKAWIEGLFNELGGARDVSYYLGSLKGASQAKESLKPEVSKPIADWVEKYKDGQNSFYSTYLRHKDDLLEVEMAYDVSCKTDDPFFSDIVAEAWFNGYTIKEEKLYTVEIPDPNSPNVTTTLMRVINGVIIYFTTNSDWVEQEGFQLTESEIRKDFDWAWQWAEEVTK